MLQYTWPGNVRELKQRIESAVAMAESNSISALDIGLSAANPSVESGGFNAYLDLPLTEARNKLVEDFERIAIQRALGLEQGNISAAFKTAWSSSTKFATKAQAARNKWHLVIIHFSRIDALRFFESLQNAI